MEKQIFKLFKKKDLSCYYISSKNIKSPYFLNKKDGFEYLKDLLLQGEISTQNTQEVLELLWKLNFPLISESSIEKDFEFMQEVIVFQKIFSVLDKAISSFVNEIIENKDKLIRDDFFLSICKGCKKHAKFFFISDDKLGITKNFSTKKEGRGIIQDAFDKKVIDIIRKVKMEEVINKLSFPEISQDEIIACN
jgi:hypothetical protein